MIFVTVGTHEQQFNRLVKYIDELKRKELVEDEIVIQTGFSTYEPQYCRWQKLYSYSEMIKYISEARIVITHGGPSSFIMPLQIGKIPIVVPRQKQFDEHVNNHQVEFVRKVAEIQKNIIVVENINDLEKAILNYGERVSSMPMNLESNNLLFVDKFKKIVDGLFEDKR